MVYASPTLRLPCSGDGWRERCRERAIFLLFRGEAQVARPENFKRNVPFTNMANKSVHPSQRELEDESHQAREEAKGATVLNGTIIMDWTRLL
jgi:hypothetical protein